MKTKETFFEIREEYQEHSIFVKASDTSTPTVQDMLDNNFTINDLYGNNTDSDYFDVDGNLLEKELLSKVDEYLKISYWDGNNWKIDFCETQNMTEFEGCVEKLSAETPSPAYYFVHEIETDSEKIKVTTSNMSGSCSPYFEELI